MDSAHWHEIFMRRCLELASKGLGSTGLNPLVGSVIVHRGRIIGEGYHMRYGGPHAEVNAISCVDNPAVLKESTLYVNLEPCSHFGKTPPCSLLIIEKKIPRVVVAMTDPNPIVRGKGITMLRNKGIEVITDILTEEARFLNRRFIVNQTLKRPYVILKWAESADGFIDKNRKPGDPIQPNWITNHTARMLVHKWRSEEAAITAGVNTVLSDNPALNVRNWSGQNPVRTIIDRNDRIPDDFRIKDDSVPTWIFSGHFSGKRGCLTDYIPVPRDFTLNEFLKILYEKGIASILVEGGEKFITSFINNELWDEARVFRGNMNFLSGIPAPKIPTSPQYSGIFRNNTLAIYVKSTT